MYGAVIGAASNMQPQTMTKEQFLSCLQCQGPHNYVEPESVEYN